MGEAYHEQRRIKIERDQTIKRAHDELASDEEYNLRKRFYKCHFPADPDGVTRCNQIMTIMEMEEHMAKHMDLARFECRNCDYKCNSIFLVEEHRQAVHTKKHRMKAVQQSRRLEIDFRRQMNCHVVPATAEEVARHKRRVGSKRTRTPGYEEDEDEEPSTLSDPQSRPSDPRLMPRAVTPIVIPDHGYQGGEIENTEWPNFTPLAQNQPRKSVQKPPHHRPPSPVPPQMYHLQQSSTQRPPPQMHFPQQDSSHLHQQASTLQQQHANYQRQGSSFTPANTDTPRSHYSQPPPLRQPTQHQQSSMFAQDHFTNQFPAQNVSAPDNGMERRSHDPRQNSNQEHQQQPTAPAHNHKGFVFSSQNQSSLFTSSTTETSRSQFSQALLPPPHPTQRQQSSMWTHPAQTFAAPDNGIERGAWPRDLRQVNNQAEQQQSTAPAQNNFSRSQSSLFTSSTTEASRAQYSQPRPHVQPTQNQQSSMWTHPAQAEQQQPTAPTPNGISPLSSFSNSQSQSSLFEQYTSEAPRQQYSQPHPPPLSTQHQQSSMFTQKNFTSQSVATPNAESETRGRPHDPRRSDTQAEPQKLAPNSRTLSLQMLAPQMNAKQRNAEQDKRRRALRAKLALKNGIPQPDSVEAPSPSQPPKRSRSPQDGEEERLDQGRKSSSREEKRYTDDRYKERQREKKRQRNSSRGSP